MDADFTVLPMSATDYLSWLRGSHVSPDNWSSFERSLQCLSAYESARDDALRLIQQGNSERIPAFVEDETPPTASRYEIFVALSRQIVAQEELRVAVEACIEHCATGQESSDAARLAGWLKTRLEETEDESRLTNLLASK